jgi:hypothetical protein
MKFIFTLVLPLLLAGCVQTTPQWESQFGASVKLAQQQQTLNPNAGGDAPVNGIEGITARETVTRYRSSFKEPQPTNNSFTIGVGR